MASFWFDFGGDDSNADNYPLLDTSEDSQDSEDPSPPAPVIDIYLECDEELTFLEPDHMQEQQELPQPAPTPAPRARARKAKIGKSTKRFKAAHLEGEVIIFNRREYERATNKDLPISE